MCQVHLIRQALKKVPKKKHKEVSEKLKEALVDRSIGRPSEVERFDKGTG
jgi:transposase-like protein